VRQTVEVRAHFRALADWLAETPADRVAEKRREADLLFHRVGITFAVYGDEAGAERLIPFDTIPRVIPRAEWNKLAAGLVQRVSALNRFLHDIYHGQEILKAGVIPARAVLTNEAYQVRCSASTCQPGVLAYCRHRSRGGTRTPSTTCWRTTCERPSGVSYMLENRK